MSKPTRVEKERNRERKQQTDRQTDADRQKERMREREIKFCICMCVSTRVFQIKRAQIEIDRFQPKITNESKRDREEQSQNED